MIKFALQWHITQKCGNNCRHCYMDDTSYDLSFAEYLTCMNNINNFEKTNDFIVSSVALTGGDPLLNMDWYNIACDLVQRGKKVSILGNPEHLTTENLEKLAGLSLTRYQLSIDGLQKTHDYIRSIGSFQRTIEGIKKLNKFNIPIGIMFTLSNVNSHELFDVIRFLDSLDIEMIFAFDFVISTGHAKENQLRNTSDTVRLYDDYLALKKEFSKKNSKVYLTEKPSTLFIHRIHEYSNEDTLRQIPFSMCGGCGAGWRHLTIIKKGDVLACRRMPVKVGNLFTDSFEDILINSPFLRELRNFNNIGQCSKCIYRKFCRGCPADTFERFGTPFVENLMCPWFTKGKIDKESFIDHDFERLNSTIYDPNVRMQSFNNDNYIKALVFLTSKNEREELCKNAEAWKNKHCLNLSNYEIGLLVYTVLDKYNKY